LNIRRAERCKFAVSKTISSTRASRFLSIPAELCGLDSPVHYEDEGVVKEKEDVKYQSGLYI
jgi:hypothetical protein